MSSFPASVRIVEVGPRDGLQSESTIVPFAQRAELVDLLTAAGFAAIEFGAFVSSKKVPQMVDSDKVYDLIQQKAGVSYIALVPNMQGMEAALAAGVKDVAVFAAASETFSIKNIDCTIDESLARFAPVLDAARAGGIRVRGYVSCVLGCPYEGAVPHDAVIRVTQALLGLGCYEVSLGDTIGVGTPDETCALLRAVKAAGIAPDRIAGHFHDTKGHALDNIRVAMEEGLTVFDSSIGGLGGCPYAPGASGNVSTEAVVLMLQELEIQTGIDFDKAVAAARYIRRIVMPQNGASE